MPEKYLLFKKLLKQYKMQFKTKDTGLLLRMTFNEWNEKIQTKCSHCLLCHFSIPGLLVLIISIAGYFFGNDTVNQNILDQISSAMGSETAMQVSQILIKSTESKSTIWGQ
jgi:membrane protein